MSKKRNVKHSKREEQQAQRVVKILFISLIVLGLVIIVGFSLLSR